MEKGDDKDDSYVSSFGNWIDGMLAIEIGRCSLETETSLFYFWTF